MLWRLGLILGCGLLPLWAQGGCEGTPAYSPCEFAFELTANDAAAHPNPYATVELRIEFRSPRFRTFLMPAFWDGGRKMVVRFVPTEGGDWSYRVSSNLTGFEGKQGTFKAAESDAPGYVRKANVHHWATQGATDDKKPHLWMGLVIDHFATMPAAEFDAAVAAAAANKFNHIRARVLEGSAYSGPDKPNVAYFAELDRRILAVHKRGITTDLMLASDPDHVVKAFPDWQSRKRFVRFLVARYSPLNLTWQGVEEFEGHRDARALLKE